jgi:hypothetical protein
MAIKGCEGKGYQHPSLTTLSLPITFLATANAPSSPFSTASLRSDSLCHATSTIGHTHALAKRPVYAGLCMPADWQPSVGPLHCCRAARHQCCKAGRQQGSKAALKAPMLHGCRAAIPQYSELQGSTAAILDDIAGPLWPAASPLLPQGRTAPCSLRGPGSLSSPPRPLLGAPCRFKARCPPPPLRMRVPAMPAIWGS